MVGVVGDLVRPLSDTDCGRVPGRAISGGTASALVLDPQTPVVPHTWAVDSERVGPDNMINNVMRKDDVMLLRRYNVGMLVKVLKG